MTAGQSAEKPSVPRGSSRSPASFSGSLCASSGSICPTAWQGSDLRAGPAYETLVPSLEEMDWEQCLWFPCLHCCFRGCFCPPFPLGLIKAGTDILSHSNLTFLHHAARRCLGETQKEAFWTLAEPPSTLPQGRGRAPASLEGRQPLSCPQGKHGLNASCGGGHQSLGLLVERYAWVGGTVGESLCKETALAAVQGLGRRHTKPSSRSWQCWASF